DRGRAAVTLPADRRSRLGEMRQRRPARLFVDPHQSQAGREMDRPYRRRGRRAGHVPAGLGDASVRRRRGAGRSRARRGRDQRSIQNSCSTGTLRAWASLIARVAEGVNTPFSTVLMVLRLTPTRSASAAWVSEAFSRSDLIELASRSVTG